MADETKITNPAAPDAAEAEAKKKAAAEKAAEAKRKKAEAEKAAEAEAKKAAEKEAKENAPFVEIARRYAEHYPACKAFHITSDKQVFLEGDKAEAEAHQREIGKDKVRTINVE